MYTLGVRKEESLDVTVGDSLEIEGDVGKDADEASAGVYLSGKMSCVGAEKV